MTTPTLHQSLQTKLGTFAGEHLSTTLRYQDRYGNTVEKPLFDAALDEVAFAIQTLHAEASVISRQRNALERLYTIARDHGCIGSNSVSQIAVEVTK